MNIDAAQGWALIITSATGAFGTLYSLVRLRHNTTEVIKAKEAAQEVKAAVVETKEVIRVTAQEVIQVKEATKEIHELTNSNSTLQRAEIAELRSMLATAQGIGQAAELTRVTLAREAALELARVPAPPVEEPPPVEAPPPLIIHPPGS